MRFDSYQTQGFRDEMFDDAGVVRPEARLLLDTIESLEEGQLLQCQPGRRYCPSPLLPGRSGRDLWAGRRALPLDR